MARTGIPHASLWRAAAAAALLALAPLFPGCSCVPRPREDARFREGMRLFLVGQYGPAAPLLRDFVREQPSSPRAAEAHYALGGIALHQGQAHEAQARFRECLRSAPAPNLAAGAAVGLARCHFQSGAYAECQAACLDILRKDPATPRADEVLFLLGEACERLGRGTEARGYFRRVADEFRSSPWAARAEARLGGASAALPPASPSGSFYVQVAALSSSASAAEHARLLAERGYPAAVSTAPSRSGDLFVVRAGPYASRADAERVAAKLKAEGFDVLVKP
ncbi:MAG TPA: SPOR domain-containing protein [Planctomycetota bacterium]|nr:SPOR domain-containing protein [Planctomycetota bacterium]HRR82041.1 SPOR domain-containing protein [Planctomycetota bacterium]HRT94536.1 SPOR domain-containing protein [Planctomycetota bacterium]